MLGRTSGGLSTCLAALMAPDGGPLLSASAGHLPPYVNGVPLDVPGSLPSGVTADVECDVHAFQLSCGDSLRFVSDGVVEAQDSAGTLLGFESTRELSRQAVQQIARRAGIRPKR